MTNVRKTDDKNQIFIVCLYLTTFFRADLFIFLFPTVGGSRSDYLASAIANAIEESKIVIDFKVESKKMNSDCCKKLYKAINSKAIYPFQAMNRLKKYNLFA